MEMGDLKGKVFVTAQGGVRNRADTEARKATETRKVTAQGERLKTQGGFGNWKFEIRNWKLETELNTRHGRTEG
jgi:hypothetical protein